MKRFILLVSICWLVVSCSEKDITNSINDTNNAKINQIAGSYKLTAYTAQYNFEPVKDTFALLSGCVKDDIQKLNTDLTYEYIDAGTTCTPSGSYKARWSLALASIITINGIIGTTIQSYDGHTLILNRIEQKTVSSPSGSVIYNTVLTLTKQ